MRKLLLYRMAVAWAVLFSVVALSTATATGLINTKWNSLDGQDRFITCLLIFTNWGNLMMAFISRSARAVEEGKSIIGNGDAKLPDETATIKKVDTKP